MVVKHGLLAISYSLNLTLMSGLGLTPTEQANVDEGFQIAVSIFQVAMEDILNACVFLMLTT